MLVGVASRALVLAYDRDAMTLGELLDRRVELLRAAHRAGDPVAAELIRGAAAAQGTDEELLDAELTVETARGVIAREHSYDDWAAAREQEERIMATGS
jgi:hypothetical protein